MGWSEFDKLVSAMWKTMGKSNSKGKGKGGQGGKGGHGGSKGGKAQGKASAAPKASTDLVCKCCGKNGHVKSDCRHREKACDNCGKTGHLKGVCQAPLKVDDASKDAAPGAATAAKKAANPPTPKVFIAPWVCGGCLHQNADQHLTKCEKCPWKKTPIPKPNASPKPLIRQNMLDLMKDNDAAAAAEEDAEMEGGDDEVKAEKEKLKAFIKQAEEWKMDATAAGKRLQELESKQPAKLLIAASTAAKDLLAEKTRIIKEFEVKRRALTEKGEKAKADQTRYEKGHKAAKDEEIDRHEKTMDSLGEQYSGHIERAKNTQKEVKEQEDAIQVQFDAAIEKLTTYIQTTVNADASQKQPEQAPAENGEPQQAQQQQQTNASITPEMICLDQIQQHLRKDLPADGATQEEMAASFIKLLNMTVENAAAVKAGTTATSATAASAAVAPAAASSKPPGGSEFQMVVPTRPLPPLLKDADPETLAITGEGGKASAKAAGEDAFTVVGKGGKGSKPSRSERSTSGDRRARSHSPRR